VYHQDGLPVNLGDGAENGPALDYFRREIREAFGGRAPRVLDMFAGGGTIPLEAMRLGCELVANGYSPVARFILNTPLRSKSRKTGPYCSPSELSDSGANRAVQLAFHRSLPICSTPRFPSGQSSSLS
jgi:hypothetical protein